MTWNCARDEKSKHARNIGRSLVYDRLRIDAFAKFHRSLREFGMKAMGFIEEQVPGQTRRQFVTAAIVSCREIEMEDLKCIIDANNKLNILQTTNTKVKFQDYFLLFKRVVVILNLPSPSIHGECRLFDPYCRIRKEICEIYNPSDFKQTDNILQHRK
jgi:ribonucleotide reductase alpha subunit